MRIPRFYQTGCWQISDTVALSEENVRHAIQVMRLTEGEPIILFNGEGGEYHATLVNVSKRAAQVRIDEYHAIDRESPLQTTLVLALIKPDKMDFAIQKAVELGVNHIQPIITERSVIKLKPARLEKKLKHWQGVMIAACEQSGRTALPAIHPAMNLVDYLQQDAQATRITMLPTSDKRISEITSDNAYELIVGPEGGFTDAEEALFQAHNIQGIHFGPRILRAETAAIAGLSALQQNVGDL